MKKIMVKINKVNNGLNVSLSETEVQGMQPL